ncbi:uncharacterized protein LOC114292244 isoform X2 [Camellia sinensis]|uniref:uncharacterized protein LOC114292244 isoform X2 n=1 Tax=Camellia sinensis TaxID=4442 RepID=UPI001035A261|nr:uncharacterized protein LOC114292244 isoform X2 [Camellia sinensis]
MASYASIRQVLQPKCTKYSQFQLSPSWVVPCSLVFKTKYISRFSRLHEFSGHRNLTAASKATSGNGAKEDEDGVSLGTMKLPLNTDIPRFESLLFQVDKIPGGARLGFITIGDGETEVLVYIDCLVFPATDGSGPVFRAIRNGSLKDQPPPGEPRIMRSLLLALKKSAEIARV